ncbi:unnamed protein product [Strongylus vulgaris]|uniref:Fibronectin type-III domain-containing protein n=1 Tax=Strongylus vulgaris TaxID=40348 RepID=A0A3P7JCR1_STRVU|nr:unnamed protein product [Strongylus vulgaris]
MECEADGEPRRPDMVRWLRNGQELKLYPTVSGGRARVRCRAHAVPDADFVWDRAGEIIQGNNTKYGMSTIQIDYSTFESNLWISNISPDDYAKEISCTARNSFGTDSIHIPIGPPSPPDAPLDIHVTNTTSSTISISWTPGFDGGFEQTFEIRYQKDGEDVMHGINTSHSNLRLSGLAPSSVYLFQLRSINSRGFSSELTRPPAAFATLSEDGTTVAVIAGKAEGAVHCEREEHDIPEASEDDHSVRTMIEVNPNGYMQQIDPSIYERNCLMEYEFDRE